MTDDTTTLENLIAGPEPVNWLLTGDSITHGLKHTQGERSYPEHLHELIRGDLARVQDIFVNTAASGWRVTQLLDDFDRRVASWHPDIVTLMIGTNDASTSKSPVVTVGEFSESVADFTRRVRRLGAIPILQTPPTILAEYAPERSRIVGFAQGIRDVALAEGAILIDHFANWERLGASGQGGAPWGLFHDPFHPNAAGHAAIALEIAETLGLRGLPDRDRLLPYLRTRVATR